MTPIRVLAVMLVLAVTPGCGALLGGDTEPLDAYELRVPADLPQAARQGTRTLSIEQPGTTGGLAIDRIMIRPTPLQAFYLPGARWTADAHLMVHGMLLRAFEDTGALSYVGRRPLGATGDFVLLSDLTDFQAELSQDGESVAVRVRLMARLVREEDATVRSARAFQAVVPAASDAAFDVVTAFDSATGIVLRDLTGWALPLMGARAGS